MTTKVAYIHHFKHRVGVSMSAHGIKLSSLRQLRDYERKAFTCAYVIDEAKGMLLGALALCSPRDNFDRKVGRRIATSRLNNLVADISALKPGQIYFTIPASELAGLTGEELTGKVLVQAAKVADQW